MKNFLVSSSKKPLLKLRGVDQEKSDAVVDDIEELLKGSQNLHVDLPTVSKVSKFLSDRHGVRVSEISIRRVVGRLALVPRKGSK